MRNFQDTFKTRKRTIYQYFFNLHDCTFKELENEINNLKTSLEFTQKNLEEKVAKVEKKLVSITDGVKELYYYQTGSEYVLQKTHRVERYCNEKMTESLRKKVKLGMNGKKKFNNYCWTGLTQMIQKLNGHQGRMKNRVEHLRQKANL